MQDQEYVEDAFEEVEKTRTRGLRLLVPEPVSPEKIIEESGSSLSDNERWRYQQLVFRMKPKRIKAPRTLGQEDIRKRLLDEDTLLLVFQLNEEQGWLWALTTEHFRTYELPGRKTLTSRAQKLAEIVGMPPGGANPGQQDVLAENLGRDLLGNLEADLKRRRLLIVKDGPLHDLPLAVLPSPWSDDLLIEDHEIINLPSASIGVWLHERALPQPEHGAMVFADPVYQTTDPRFEQTEELASLTYDRDLTRSMQTYDLETLPRLPYTAREAASISALVPGTKVASGFQASREAVLNAELNQYQMVHFATHSLLNPVYPEFSGLVLSLLDANGQNDQGFLKAHELAGMNLNVELVTLSACHTGVGPEIRGQGAWSLSHALLEAGAKRVVVSLWPVNDRATAVFMEHFYRNIWEQKQSPAEALAQAQRQMRQDERWSHAYYWSGFVIQGAWKDFHRK